MPQPVQLGPHVVEAFATGRPVVALESTLVAHGLARPNNLVVAHEVEAIVWAEGAVPATVGVIAGTPVIGLDAEELARIATRPGIPKLSMRDLPIAVARGSDGATTVASTAFLAAGVGIRLFATGGLGGVHREAHENWDESSDLLTLSRTAIAVVCSGVKSILDVGATLERLETLNVAVVGFRTKRFPGFYLAESDHALDWSVETEAEAAAVIAAQHALGMDHSALVIANPIPAAEQLDPALHDRVLGEALAECKRRGVRGKAVTPFLLEYFRNGTRDESHRVNGRIIRNNARLAARIARAWAERGTGRWGDAETGGDEGRSARSG